jgi:hypothetical protein
MDTEKNLHAAIPPALLAKVQDVAQAERITVDELVQDAVQRLSLVMSGARCWRLGSHTPQPVA